MHLCLGKIRSAFHFYRIFHRLFLFYPVLKFGSSNAFVCESYASCCTIIEKKKLMMHKIEYKRAAPPGIHPFWRRTLPTGDRMGSINYLNVLKHTSTWPLLVQSQTAIRWAREQSLPDPVKEKKLYSSLMQSWCEPRNQTSNSLLLNKNCLLLYGCVYLMGISESFFGICFISHEWRPRRTIQRISSMANVSVKLRYGEHSP